MSRLDPQTRRGKLISKLMAQCEAEGIILTPYYSPIAGRRFRFDAAIPHCRVLVEILDSQMDATALQNRCEKVTLAGLQGWGVVSITPRHIRGGEAVGWIGDMMALRGEVEGTEAG